MKTQATYVANKMQPDSADRGLEKVDLPVKMVMLVGG